MHADAIDAFMDTKRAEAIGQFDLFGCDDGDGAVELDAVFDVPIPTGEWDKTALLAFEREMLGLYVSDHPLLGIEHVLAGRTPSSTIAGADEHRPDGDGAVTVGGILSGVHRAG